VIVPVVIITMFETDRGPRLRSWKADSRRDVPPRIAPDEWAGREVAVKPSGDRWGAA
jgi:hypothetical protein